jgi:Flp pilus assembly protein TadG
MLLRGKQKAARNRRGSSMIEFALLLPWYVFLFMGAFDYGFFSYSLIATQNAARVAAMYCSGSSSRAASCDACIYVLDQLRNMANVGSAMTTCSASPVQVTASKITGPDSADAAQVVVTYTTPNLLPIPHLLPGTITIQRTAVMRVLT